MWIKILIIQIFLKQLTIPSDGNNFHWDPPKKHFSPVQLLLTLGRPWQNLSLKLNNQSTWQHFVLISRRSFRNLNNGWDTKDFSNTAVTLLAKLIRVSLYNCLGLCLCLVGSLKDGIGDMNSGIAAPWFLNYQINSNADCIKSSKLSKSWARTPITFDLLINKKVSSMRSSRKTLVFLI